MKAQNVIIGFRKIQLNEVEAEYRGYIWYKGKAIASMVGERNTTDTADSLKFFLDGKPVELETIITKAGKRMDVAIPDINLFINPTASGSVGISGSYISDFGLFFPVSGWLNKEKGSCRLTLKEYDPKNEYDQKAKASFIQKYGTIADNIPECDFSDEDLTESDKLFPEASDFFELFIKEKPKASSKVNPNAPRIMPSSRKKAPVTQEQLDLAKKQALAKTKVTDEDMEISF